MPTLYHECNKYDKQNSGFPSGATLDDLKVSLTLKLGEKCNPHLGRWRPGQSAASPAVRGGQEGAGPWRSLCVPGIYLNRASLKGISVDCLLCGRHGIYLIIKIVSAYSKKVSKIKGE